MAIILRLLAAIYLGNSLVGVQQDRIQDQNSYDALAQSLLGGRGYSFEMDYWYPGFTRAGEQTAHWSFLYPAFLAGVYGVFGHYPLAARLVQVLISGILSTWLFYRLGQRLGGKTVGLVTAALGAVYIYFVYHDAALMTESFFTLGILAIFVLSLKLVEPGSDIEGNGSIQPYVDLAAAGSRHGPYHPPAPDAAAVAAFLAGLGLLGRAQAGALVWSAGQPGCSGGLHSALHNP
jgi:hypothetical protein